MEIESPNFKRKSAGWVTSTIESHPPNVTPSTPTPTNIKTMTTITTPVLPVLGSGETGGRATSLSSSTATTPAASPRASSFQLFIRDTSMDGQGDSSCGIETSRVTVNTHNSILNITEDDDDEDVSLVPLRGAPSFGLFEDRHQTSPPPHDPMEDSVTLDYLSVFSEDPNRSYRRRCGGGQDRRSPLPHRPNSRSSKSCHFGCHDSTANVTSKKHTTGTHPNHSLFLDFFDGLCSASANNSPTTTTASGIGGTQPPPFQHDKEAVMVCRRVLEYDIMDLLGCSQPPDQEEINRVWQFSLVPPAVTTTPSHGGGGYSSACYSALGGSLIPPSPTTSTVTPPPASLRSRRRPWQERALYVHRLRVERTSSASSPSVAALPTSLSPSSGRPLVPTKCWSMDDRFLPASHSRYHHNDHHHFPKQILLAAWSALFSVPSTKTKTTEQECSPDHSIRDGRSRYTLNPWLSSQEGGGGDAYDSDPEEQTLAFPPPSHKRASTACSSGKSMTPLSRTNSRSSNGSGSREDEVTQGGSPQSRDPLDDVSSCSSSFDDPNRLVQTVQETLNMSWTVTWYPLRDYHRPDDNKDTSTNTATANTKTASRRRIAMAEPPPRTVQVWIERGTMIEGNTVMLEPNLMWRETYQPELSSRRKLNASSQKPHSIRLLNLCRILSVTNPPSEEGHHNDDNNNEKKQQQEVSPSSRRDRGARTSGEGGSRWTRDGVHVSLDRSRYPLVRPWCCTLIRTSDGQEHLFETKTSRERDDMVRRWKLTTVRFATLAVMEDLETISQEFFSPLVANRMLVPHYVRPLVVEDDDDDDYEEEDDNDDFGDDDYHNDPYRSSRRGGNNHGGGGRRQDFVSSTTLTAVEILVRDNGEGEQYMDEIQTW